MNEKKPTTNDENGEAQKERKQIADREMQMDRARRTWKKEEQGETHKRKKKMGMEKGPKEVLKAVVHAT